MSRATWKKLLRFVQFLVSHLIPKGDCTQIRATVIFKVVKMFGIKCCFLTQRPSLVSVHNSLCKALSDNGTGKNRGFLIQNSLSETKLSNFYH